MDPKKYEKLFKQIIKKRHGMDIDFETIESCVKHLREGEPLTYCDLEIIADDSCWPFSKYWMWPSREQIEKELENTTGWFMDLPNDEEVIIKNLCAIFRNIALVSIVLRFACPKHYVIYSRPPLKILRIERGTNDVEECLIYVGEMRLLRRSFGVPKTADVDMIVWTIAQEKGQYLRDFKKLLTEKLPENLTPAELMTYLSNEPLKIAEAYLNQKAYKTAGFWASKAFEKFLRDECIRAIGFIPEKHNGEIQSLINCLCRTSDYRFLDDELHRLRKLRNKAVHRSDAFNKGDASSFVEGMRDVMK